MVDSVLLNNLFEKLKSKKSLVVFAESLTGGLISAEFSKIHGVSSVLWGGFVVYNTCAKVNVLSIPKEIIDTYGVVSRECAVEMAKGALKTSYSRQDPSPFYSLGVTGLAGPATKDDKLRVGTVYIAVARIDKVTYHDVWDDLIFDISSISKVFHFEGDRNSIREQTLNNGMELLMKLLK